MGLSQYSAYVFPLVAVFSGGVLFSFLWLLMKRLRRKSRFSPFTEHCLRLPGHSLRKQKGKLQDDYLFVVFGFMFGVGVIAVGLVFTDGATLFGYVIAGLGIAIWSLYRVAKLFDHAQAVSLGLEGEEFTGQELSLLMKKGAFVFHDLPYKYGNIDHIVIGNETVFAVETKAVRKPTADGGNASRDSTVHYDGSALKFPHFTTDKPLKQAACHASYLKKAIRNACGFEFPVKGVVAIPGWYVDSSSVSKTDVLALNPSRGRSLNKWVGGVENKVKRDAVIRYVHSVARSVPASSRRFDPGWQENYDFWSDPKYQEPVL